MNKMEAPCVPVKLEIVKRSEWTRIANPEPQKIHHPADIVWYTVTNTKPCTDSESCIQRAKAIMREHRLDFKRKDIAYNFLVGGDGKVIEAKGWHGAPDLPVHFLSLRHKSIYIAYIGWYCTYEEMPMQFYHIAKQLIKNGVANNYITSKFVLNDLLTFFGGRQRYRLENDEFIHGYYPYYR